MALAKDLKCLFHECSARTRDNVNWCFEELALKVRKNLDGRFLLSKPVETEESK